MSIATVYGKITDLIEATLPNHKRLPNPYDIGSNTFLHMIDQAFGLAVDPGTNTERYQGCLASWEQTYSIVLIRRVVTTENNTDARETIELNLLSDWELLWKAFENNNSLDGNVIKATVLGNGGINFFDIKNQKFLSMFVNLSVEHQDTF